ncbi:MAG: hypothetical protein HY241_13810 [Actinobacteria bacterium]|nr:hypothetical protein [Actinomycetota bacterium]
MTTTVAVLIGATGLALAWLDHATRNGVVRWASTSVDNLGSHPVGSLLGSAFVVTEELAGWVLLSLLGLVAAERAVGSVRLLVAVAAAQVLGTLVSEGIVAWRVAHAALPLSQRGMEDVGPSYLVVAGLTIGLLRGSWPGRAAAAVGWWLLGPDLFDGLSRLDVAAVGHVVSIAAGVVASGIGATPRPAPGSGAGRGR